MKEKQRVGGPGGREMFFFCISLGSLPPDISVSQKEVKKMRCFYREKRYYSGNYLEIDIYPVFGRAGQRRKRYKESSECQKKLNRKNAEMKLTRLLNTNFTEDDLRFDLTYSPNYLPNDDDAAIKELRNFLRRLKRFRKKAGLDPLKYVAVTEKSSRGRYHHHLVISGGVSMRDLAYLWGRGYTTCKPLQFDEYGIEALAHYLVKEPVGSKFYQASRNLTQPEVETRDEAFSQKTVNAMAKICQDPALWEGLYEGYTFVSAAPFWNDYNRHQSITVKMYIPPKKK